MSRAPRFPRAISFVDGQNLFHAAREQFGRAWPDYDVLALSRAVCRGRGWDLQQVHFYTGIPERRFDPRWNGFWVAKLGVMGNAGVRVHSRHLRHRVVRWEGPDGERRSIVIHEEKGIDLRIAIDVIRHAFRRAYDVALLFSQDQDFVEVAREIRDIAHEQRRWIKIASAFPHGTRGTNAPSGIDGTDWIPIDRDTYESCLDPRDYRPRSP